MKKILIAATMLFAFGCFAQNSPDTSNSAAKGDKTVKGCLQSENGNYMLQRKDGPNVKLSGSSDLATHIGQEVALRGEWEHKAGSERASKDEGAADPNGATDHMGSMANGVNGGGGLARDAVKDSSHVDDTFLVSSVDTLSSQCKQ